jgi:4-alpha-glucanotransferase
MREANILAYRVLYFERGAERSFLPPDHVPAEALVCVSTHDLPTLRGWWAGADIGLRCDLGLQRPDVGEWHRGERAADRRQLLRALAGQNLLPEPLREAAEGSAEPPHEVGFDLLVAVHRYLARSPARLAAVQIEDLLGVAEQANLPGTTHQHPNWRRKLPIPLEELAAHPTFAAVAEALREERPR